MRLAICTLAIGLTACGSASAVDVTQLPLGDGKYRTSPAKGYVFSCQTRFQGGGAFREGPWIDSEAGTWNLKEKLEVQGSVKHDGSFSTRLSSSRLVATGNGLPSFTTGMFPVQQSDPAYQYDRNPNSIKGYTLKVSLPRNPRVASKPTCIGGTVGLMKDGIPLFSAFDAGGRDAVANEIQDKCDGHPQMSGQYHHHGLPSCVKDTASKSAHSSLFGWAIDGFGIYGQRGTGGKQLSTANLDACHGHTHTITWNGKKRRIYHYHATLDFPYTVSCYRGTPITSATGLGIGRPG